MRDSIGQQFRHWVRDHRYKTAISYNVYVPPRRVLIVDDEIQWRRILYDNLSFDGYQCSAVASALLALAETPRFSPDVALVDVRMPGMDGISLLKEFRSRKATARLPVVFITGFEKIAAMRAIRNAGFGFVPVLEKNMEIYQPRETIERLLSTDRCRSEIEVDHPRRVIRFGEKEIRLSAREFELFLVLLACDGPVSGKDLHCRVFPGSDDSSVVNVNILRLRRKIAKQTDAISIVTVADGFAIAFNEHYNL